MAEPINADEPIKQAAQMVQQGADSARWLAEQLGAMAKNIDYYWESDQVFHVDHIVARWVPVARKIVEIEDRLRNPTIG